MVRKTQALQATTTRPSVDATSDGQKSGRSAAVAVGTGPCATGERPSRQDPANLHPGMLVAPSSLLATVKLMASWLCCCLVTLATVKLMLWPIIFLASSGTVSGCMAYMLAPFA